MDWFILALMIAGGIVFFGGITYVLLSLACDCPRSSKKAPELERDSKVELQSSAAFKSQPSTGFNSISGAHTVYVNFSRIGTTHRSYVS